MPLPPNFIPTIPFPEFKWKWATLQCTEGINDPVVLLGVLSCMNECIGKKYSSQEFADSLAKLTTSVPDNAFIQRIATRTGERNIMRNSGQYWKALGLIPSASPRGYICLTPFGRALANREISQSDFAAYTVLTLTLPNPNTISPSECALWEQEGIRIRPLSLLLEILLGLYDRYGSESSYLTANEMISVIIPLSSSSEAKVEDYVNFVVSYRKDRTFVRANWPSTSDRANDMRYAREHLLFLTHYGYTVNDDDDDESTVYEIKHKLNISIIEEVRSLVSCGKHFSISTSLDAIKNMLTNTSVIIGDMERKRIHAYTNRKNQASFRKSLMEVYPRCVVSGVSMPEVLEAAHIKPFAYHGEDKASNGFLLRSDIHILFDSGDLRISPAGEIILSERARMSYGEGVIRHDLNIPDYVDKSNIEWRWNFYHGI